MTEDAIRNWNNAGADAEDDSQRVSMLLSAGDALAAALTTLARDLASARQERDHLQYANEKIVALNKGTIDSLRAKLAASDAAVRAARAETWAAAADIAKEWLIADMQLLSDRFTERAAREGQ